MKIIPGALVGKISGSLGGMTASHGRGGYYLRNRVVPTNPASAAQFAARNAFTALVTAWQAGLSEDQREAWSVYAANVPTTDRLGESLVLTGQQMYVRCNQPRLRAGLGVVDDAPIIFNSGEPLAPDTINGTIAAGVLSINATLDPGGIDDATWLVQISRPLAASINFFRGPFRLAGIDDIDGSGAYTVSPAATFVPPVAGQRVRLRHRVSYDDGRLSPVMEHWVTLEDEV